MKHSRILTLTTVMLLLAGLVMGCSSETEYGPTGTISGRLTYLGKPIQEATQVVFMHPEKGYAAFGTTDADGNFTVDSWNDGNMPIGPYRVMVQPPASELNPDNASPEQLLEGEGGSVPSESEFPFKYRQTSTSGLSFTVEEGPNNFEIDLED